MLNSAQKKQIVLEYNFNNKTMLRYIEKTDSVMSDNSRALPVKFDVWYAKV